MLFGNKIRELREEKGLLLREVAALLEIDTATVSKIELGSRSIKKEQIKLLANVLDADVSELQTLWLASKIYELVKEEDNAIDALKATEEKFKYSIKGNNK